MLTRRQFLRTTSVATAAVATADLSFAFRAPEKGRFAISLAEWSLHKALFKKEITNLDFARLYRPQTNVVSRPVAGVGRGYSLIGHHEIMIPLLAAALIDGGESC